MYKFYDFFLLFVFFFYKKMIFNYILPSFNLKTHEFYFLN
jgi:hypothetical protein